MKNLILFLGLPVAIWLPMSAHADTKILVEYEGDTHTVVQTFTVPTRGVPQQIIAQKTKPLTVSQNHVLLSWEGPTGVSSTLMEDPRMVHAPMTEDGQGHGAAVTREKGAYLLTIKGDDIKLDTLKLTFPGAQNFTKLNVLPDLD